MNRVEGRDPSSVALPAASSELMQADNSSIIEQEETTWKPSEIAVEIVQDRYGPPSDVDMSSVLSSFQKRPPVPVLEVSHPPVKTADPMPLPNMDLLEKFKQNFKNWISDLRKKPTS